jgi:hypothetical protein
MITEVDMDWVRTFQCPASYLNSLEASDKINVSKDGLSLSLEDPFEFDEISTMRVGEFRQINHAQFRFFCDGVRQVYLRDRSEMIGYYLAEGELDMPVEKFKSLIPEQISREDLEDASRMWLERNDLKIKQKI